MLRGIRVGAVDQNGHGRADLMTGAGPHVRVLNGQTLTDLDNFFAFDSGFGGGIFVADR